MNWYCLGPGSKATWPSCWWWCSGVMGWVWACSWPVWRKLLSSTSEYGDWPGLVGTRRRVGC